MLSCLWCTLLAPRTWHWTSKFVCCDDNRNNVMLTRTIQPEGVGVNVHGTGCLTCDILSSYDVWSWWPWLTYFMFDAGGIGCR